MNTTFLALELCLSERADLINVFVRQVLESRMPVLSPGFKVVAHVVETDPVVKLHFLLVSARTAVAQLRQSLIAAGEMMIDQIFSESPWEMPPLLTLYGKKVQARLEVYAKCTITDEESWFVRQVVPASEAPLVLAMTVFLREKHFELRSLKTVLPILILNACPRTASGLQSAVDSNLNNAPSERRSWVQRQLAAMNAKGPIPQSRLTPADEDLLHTLECYVTEIAHTLHCDSMLVVRTLLKQLGFREVEREYLTLIALEMRALNGEPRYP